LVDAIDRRGAPPLRRQRRRIQRGREFTYVPAQVVVAAVADAAYVHVCTNETIGGVEYQWIPDTGTVPLVADASSNLLSRPLDVHAFRPDLRRRAEEFRHCGSHAGHRPRRPARPHAARMSDGLRLCEAGGGDSLLNTLPTFAVYVAGLVCEWLQALGGLPAIERANIAKATLLYDEIDRTGFWRNPVRRGDRSRMNVPFFLRDDRLSDQFLVGRKERGLVQLKGHRAAGGMRASIYNAMPMAGVQALVDYLRDFERAHG
jgi:phosphoserine aminotransferase